MQRLRRRRPDPLQRVRALAVVLPYYRRQGMRRQHRQKGETHTGSVVLRMLGRARAPAVTDDSQFRRQRSQHASSVANDADATSTSSSDDCKDGSHHGEDGVNASEDGRHHGSDGVADAIFRLWRRKSTATTTRDHDSMRAASAARRKQRRRNCLRPQCDRARDANGSTDRSNGRRACLCCNGATSEGDTDAAAEVTSSSNDGPSRPAHGPSRSHRRHRPAHRPAHDQQVRRQRPPGTAFFNNYMLDMLHLCLSPRSRDVVTFVLSRRMRRDRHAA